MPATEAYFKYQGRYEWRKVAPVALVITACWCGIPYAIPEDLERQMRRNTNQASYCPLGHSMVFKSGNEEKIRRLEAQLVHERDQKKATERRLNAQKAATTRVKNRARAGVCPDCKRSFQNVVRHMETKHPELVPGGIDSSRPGELPES